MFLKKLIGKEAKGLVDSVGGILDNAFTSSEEKSEAMRQIADLVNNSLLRVMDIQASVLKTEMTGNWLQRSWRPIIMLMFATLLFIRWTGWVDHDISEALEMKLMSIMQVSLGGYIAGRSIEKVSSTLSKNMQLPFLKKKDRKLIDFDS